jgi:hypothetical protein
MANQTTISHTDKRFRPYRLASILPEGHALILNTLSGVLTQVSPDGCFVEQQSLTQEETYLAVELLASYPNFCPDAVLLSAKTQEAVEVCAARLQWAYGEPGQVDIIMRPVRNLLSRCRVKLHPFGIDVKSIIETGYVLMPVSGKRGAA